MKVVGCFKHNFRFLVSAMPSTPYTFADCGMIPYFASSESQMKLTLEHFDYRLAPEKIAIHPTAKRDGSLLCEMNPDGEITDRAFKDLAGILPPHSLLVLNDSAVFKARIHHTLPSGKTIEILLLEPPHVHHEGVLCMGRNLLKLGLITLAQGLRVSFRRDDHHRIRIRFHNVSQQQIDEWLQNHGSVPLPPYMKRHPVQEDKTRYQNIYASQRGSAAAPTAGLHFSHDTFQQLKNRDIQWVFVRLHISSSTFLPVRCTNPADHPMHTERFMVPTETLKTIFDYAESKSKIIIVGTTALRALESIAQACDHNKSQALRYGDIWHDTQLFISPESFHHTYSPWLSHGLITNFHAPQSTLLMLVAALIGYSKACKLYDHILRHNYRLLSYGDSSLLWWK